MQINNVGLSDSYNNKTSFKALTAPPKAVIEKKLGKPFADAFETVKPMLEELAKDVDITLVPHKNELLSFKALAIYTRALKEARNNTARKMELAGNAIPWHNNKEFLSEVIIKQAEKCKKAYFNLI